jgi:hypothetical protein
MREPRRLLEASSDEFERDLLASSSDDQPTARAYRRTLTSIGVGLVLPLGAAGAAQGAALATAAAPAAKLGSAVLAKWLATGALLGAVTASGAKLASHAGSVSGPAASASAARGQAPAPPSGALSAPAAVAPVVSAFGPSAARPPSQAPIRRAPAPAGAPPPLPLAPAATPAAVPAEPAVAFSAPAVGPAPAASLQREMAFLEDARHALARGDARAAVVTLESYVVAFPRGVLLPEARVLEVSALLQSGERARAEALGRRIIERDPSGAHAEAVRARLSADKR